ncbi:hypothetical protein ACLOJK_013571 [Asimina triloba]
MRESEVISFAGNFRALLREDFWEVLCVETSAMGLEGMEDLEGFLMEEEPVCMEWESSFGSCLDAWWDGQISELDGGDLDLFSLLEEGAPQAQHQCHRQHPSSSFSIHGNEDEQPPPPPQYLPLQEEGGGEEESRFTGSPDEFDSDFFSFLKEDDKEEDSPILHPSSSFGSINQTNQTQRVSPQQQSNDEDEDEEEESESDDKKGNAPNSKNLVSERNRRKRLNQQLFTLRSLVPNITKMDKRSILVDALAYLQSILQEIEKEKENANIGPDSSWEDSSPVMEEEIPPAEPKEFVRCSSPPAISQIEVDKLDAERFAVKIGCNRAMGALSQVQRIFESLGMEITFNSINQLDNDHMLTTAFLRAKKKALVTEEKLKKRAKTMAVNLGLHLSPDPRFSR